MVKECNVIFLLGNFPLMLANWNATVKKTELLRFYLQVFSLFWGALMRSSCAYVCMGVRGWCQVSFSITLHCSFWDRLSQLKPELTDLLGWLTSKSQGPFGFCLPNTGVTPVLRCQVQTVRSGLHMGFGDMNSGTHACMGVLYQLSLPSSQMFLSRRHSECLSHTSKLRYSF